MYFSALTNSGEFDKTFSLNGLNEFGLISDYTKAKEFQKRLPIDYPNEEHVDCFLYEVWRHKIIGRKTVSSLTKLI